MNLNFHESGNEKGVAGQQTPFDTSQQHSDATAILASKSTDTAVQQRKVVKLLTLSGRDTYEFRRNGISHPAGRVRELIAQGYDIRCTRITTVDENGFVHVGVGYYCLVSAPEAAQ